jgi:hypothetical protein
MQSVAVMILNFQIQFQSQTSIGMVAQMDEVFAIDKKDQKENLSPSDGPLLRQKPSLYCSR